MIEVENLTKKFGHFAAVDDVSFRVEKGEIFGLLGPNGAGKTTTIRCLLTLLKATSGTMRISGIDVSRHPQDVRQLCGYVPQEISVDGDLTGRENLSFYAKLYYVSRANRGDRISKALEFMQLSDRANHLAKTYSGGMMRRLEIGQVLLSQPHVLFLDEPCIGLDPAAKRMIWDYVIRLREQFDTTIIITTHDMLEADELCDRIAIMNGGKITITGSPDELKQQVGRDVISITTSGIGGDVALCDLGYRILKHPDDGVFDLIVDDGQSEVPRIIEGLREHGIGTKSVSLKQATLDDVFLKYAGRRIEESEVTWESVKAARRAAKRLGK
ncbi:MAG: ATP-binding cassette domain-containing protein [Dehalococcoidales bacterium]|nr:ATP-binding cassette domain-containing protein [Dehalococcoidales bacterium]